MYARLCSKLPRPLVNGLYAIWYAGLMLLVYYYLAHDHANFYYLHR